MASHGQSRSGPQAVRAPQLDELRTFCAAAELGSLGRAAQRMHVSQPSISRRLHALEDLVGVPLLERSPRGVTLTPAGERMYAHARRITADVEELGGLVEELRGSTDTVQLAISHTAAEFLMPKALVLMHRHTHAPVEVLVANSRVVKRMVRSGETDVGIAACMENESVEGVANVPLLDDEIVLAVPLGHPWARTRSVPLAELARTPIVIRDPAAHTRQVIDRVLEERGLGELQVDAEVGSTQAAKDEAHELNMPVLMSALALSIADRLEIVGIEGLRFQRRFSILHSYGALPAACRQLIDAFTESAAALGAST